MRKILCGIVLCTSWLAQSQASEPAAALTFDQSVARCENKWFGYEGANGKTVLGFAYIDPSAGFTFEHYGYLDSSSGALRAIESELHEKARVISRVDRNFPAACLTDAQVEELGLPASPESMKFYADGRPLGEHHASWAYHYNHIGASDIALDHVAKAIEAGYSSPGLTFEHAYALNALGRFKETISFLAPTIASGEKTSDMIAELAYAHLMEGEYPKAIDLYTQAIDYDKGNPSQRRWEFARNIAAAYQQLGKIKERDQWIELSDRYREAGK